MSKVGLDTNILLRLADPGNESFRIADEAINAMVQSGYEVVLVPQALYEFWNVATRTLKANGLALSTEAVMEKLCEFERDFRVLSDSAATFAMWRRMLDRYQVRGVNSHDLRLAAAHAVHGVRPFLTFNRADFVRYAEVDVIDSADVDAWLDRVDGEAD